MTWEHLYIVGMGSNIHEGSDAGTIGAHGEAMTASSIMNISGTWCNKFCKEPLKLHKRMCNTIQSQTSTCSVLGKPFKRAELSGDQEVLVLTKDSKKIVFDIKIMTKNCVIFCVPAGKTQNWCSTD